MSECFFSEVGNQILVGFDRGRHLFGLLVEDNLDLIQHIVYL
jgi:hypothetical protein